MGRPPAAVRRILTRPRLGPRLADGEHGLAGDAAFSQRGEGVVQVCPGERQADGRVETASDDEAGQGGQVGAGWLGVCVGQVADQPRALVAEEIVNADRRFLGVAGAEDDRSARRDLTEGGKAANLPGAACPI
jgi:hypothetical protein